MHNNIQVSFNGWLVPSVNDLISKETYHKMENE